MKTINPNIYPNGGYYFKDSDGARIFGDSWKAVISRVTAYRQRRNASVGDVVAEVMAQACQRNPDLCVDSVHPSMYTKRQPLKSRVLTWLNRLKGEKDRRFVEDEVMKQRAAICSKCAQNQELPGGCASCKQAMKSLREEVLGRRFTDGRLHACAILGEDLPTSVQLDSQTVEDGELPAHCWRKRK